MNQNVSNISANGVINLNSDILDIATDNVVYYKTKDGEYLKATISNGTITLTPNTFETGGSTIIVAGREIEDAVDFPNATITPDAITKAFQQSDNQDRLIEARLSDIEIEALTEDDIQEIDENKSAIEGLTTRLTAAEPKIDASVSNIQLSGRRLTITLTSGGTITRTLPSGSFHFDIYTAASAVPPSLQTVERTVVDGTTRYGSDDVGYFDTHNDTFTPPTGYQLNSLPTLSEGESVYRRIVSVVEVSNKIQIRVSDAFEVGDAVGGITQAEAVPIITRLVETAVESNSTFRSVLNTMYNPDADSTTDPINEMQAAMLTVKQVTDNTTATGLLAVMGKILVRAEEIEDTIEAFGEPEDIDFRITTSGGGGGGKGVSAGDYVSEAIQIETVWEDDDPPFGSGPARNPDLGLILNNSLTEDSEGGL